MGMVGAVIFGMERTTPHRHSKVVGLDKFSARTGQAVDAAFFREHVEVDPSHNLDLLEQAAGLFTDPKRVVSLGRGAAISFDARAVLLDSLAEHVGAQRLSKI